MDDKVRIVGVGMVPFRTASRGERPEAMAERAVRAALDDARLDFDLVDQAIAGFVDGDIELGEHALRRIGVSGIPLTGVHTHGASGSLAFFHARQAVLSGEAECALALGFGETPSLHGIGQPAATALQWSVAQIDWLERELGIGEATLAAIAVKSRVHARGNPYALLREPISSADVLASPIVAGRMHELYGSPASCGAAAVIVCAPRYAGRYGLRDDVVVLANMMGSDGFSEMDSPVEATAESRVAMRRLAEKLYARAGVGPDEIDVAEIHDPCVSNELVLYAALGICAESGIEAFVRSGANTYGGKLVVGPSGGLLANGDPAGATGLAQLCELTWHLRGEAGSRQVEGARTALQHNGGVAGATSVAILQCAH